MGGDGSGVKYSGQVRDGLGATLVQAASRPAAQPPNHATMTIMQPCKKRRTGPLEAGEG